MCVMTPYIKLLANSIIFRINLKLTNQTKRRGRKLVWINYQELFFLLSG